MTTGRSDHRGVVIVGAAAVLAVLLLMRGRGFGSTSGGVGVTVGGPPCQVFIRRDWLELDGEGSDLATIVRRCSETGHAHVRAGGDAIVRRIGEVIGALQSAGVSIAASPDVWRSAYARAA